MAQMVSFLSIPGYATVTKNKIESNMLALSKFVEDKSYMDNYSDACDLVIGIYKTLVTEVYNNNQSETMVGLIKRYFNGNLTRAIYTLILQDVVDTITISNYVVDFSKYLTLVEDKDDIAISEQEFGKQLVAFATPIDLEIKDIDATLINSNQELDILINKLGVIGMYYFYKAIFKIAAVVVKR